MKKNLLILATIILSIAFANAALAGANKWWKSPETIQKLNLTDDQAKKIETTAAEFKTKTAELRAEKKSIEAKLEQLLNSSNPDFNAAKELIGKFESVHSDISRQRMLMLLEIRKLLTQEQYLKLNALRQDFNSN
jgi:Spy/CpxP family protein refolding chaperone